MAPESVVAPVIVRVPAPSLVRPPPELEMAEAKVTF